MVKKKSDNLNDDAKKSAEKESVEVNSSAAKQVQIPFQIAMESSFGAASFLAGKSESHKFLFAQDFDWLIVPPVGLRQFKIFRQQKNNLPIAFVSWALINEEVEQRILSGNRKLAPKEWNSGKKAYLIDIISPFLNQRQVLEKLAETEFKDKELSLTKASKDGKGLVTVQLKELLAQLHKDEKETNTTQ